MARSNPEPARASRDAGRDASPRAASAGHEDPDADVRRPAVDLVQTPGRMDVTLGTPGVSRETVEIETEKERITIRASLPDGRMFQSVVDLPERVDPCAVDASCRNGVLDITIPRPRAATSRGDEGDHDGG